MEYKRKPTMCWSISSRRCRIGCVCLTTSSSTSSSGGSNPRYRVPSARGIRYFHLLAWPSIPEIRHFADRQRTWYRDGVTRLYCLFNVSLCHGLLIALSDSERYMNKLAGLPLLYVLDRSQALRRTAWVSLSTWCALHWHDPSLYFFHIVALAFKLAFQSTPGSERFPNSRAMALV